MIAGLFVVLFVFSWCLIPAILIVGLRTAGRWYNRRHQPPTWSDDDFIWAEQQGITVPEGSEQ